MRVPTTAALFAALCLLSAPASAQLIVIDPGHGGNDPGAVGCGGLQEAPSVLDVGLRTEDLLEAQGLNVDMTRNDNTFVELSARAAFANSRGADLFVSIHSNANSGTPASGTETFIYTSASGTSLTMATHLQNEMIAAWGLPDRGVKRANFSVLRNTNMPAALTEIGFTNRCTPDAALIGSPDGRLDSAIAHARAIMLTLGRDPGLIGGGSPGGDTGVLRGVVFEDVGAGLEDTTRRLSGAAMSLDGASMGTSAADTGSFRFDNLAAGPRTVEASLAGFEMGMRTCDVSASGDTWCSLGLVRSSPGGVDAGPPPPVDAGRPLASDAGPPPPPVDAGPRPDSGPIATDEDAGPTGPGRPGAADGCSCSATSPGPSPAPWFTLLGLALLGWRRTRRSATRRSVRLRSTLTPSLAAAMLLVGCGGDSDAVRAPITGSSVAETAERGPASSPETPQALPPLELTITRFASLGLGAPIGEGLVEPQLSPDGQRVAMSSADHNQLWVYHEGTLEQVAEGPRVGYRPVFSASGATLRYRHPQQSATAVPHYSIELDAEPAALDEAQQPELGVRIDDSNRVVLRGLEGGERVISPEGDRYLQPSISGDRRHVVFWGMQSGLFLYRIADGAVAAIGPGGHPSFDPSGRYLIFDRTEDDGHRLTAGDLYLADLETRRVGALTDTPEVIEGWPTLAAGRVAYGTAEGVIVAPLVLED